MHAEPTIVLKILSDPTRRAIFERLSRDGEMTVHALTGPSGVSQPAISKHLGALSWLAWCADGVMDARRITAPSRKHWRR